MLDDELKKALEPIKTSDELLEKTRKAIEQARLQQAKETIAENEPKKAVRSGLRNSFYLKAMIPVACAILLFAGAILLLPKLFKEKKGDNLGRGAIHEHNGTIGEAVAEVDGVIDHEYSPTDREDTRTEAQENEAATDVEVDGVISDGKDSAGTLETSDSISLNIDPYYKNKTLMFNPNLSDRLSIKHSVTVGSYILTISKDKKDLYLSNPSTGATVENTDEHAAPAIKDMLFENETISGLLYDETSQLLYISTEEEDAVSIDSVHLFICGYDDGKVTKDLERIG